MRSEPPVASANGPEIVSDSEFVESAAGFRDLDLDLLDAYLKLFDRRVLDAATGWFLERHPEMSTGVSRLLARLEKRRPQQLLYLGGRRAGSHLQRRWMPASDLCSAIGGSQPCAGVLNIANVTVRAGENDRLENLCRYILRPPVAQDALEVTADGRVLLRLRRPWRDGTRALCFEPSEFLEKLAVVIPRPRINLLV